MTTDKKTAPREFKLHFVDGDCRVELVSETAWISNRETMRVIEKADYDFKVAELEEALDCMKEMRTKLALAEKKLASARELYALEVDSSHTDMDFYDKELEEIKA